MKSPTRVTLFILLAIAIVAVSLVIVFQVNLAILEHDVCHHRYWSEAPSMGQVNHIVERCTDPGAPKKSSVVVADNGDDLTGLTLSELKSYRGKFMYVDTDPGESRTNFLKKLKAQLDKKVSRKDYDSRYAR